MIDSFKANRINNILEKRVFDGKIVINDEVKERTGISINELLYGYIFSSKNHFKEELRKWKETGKPINAKKALSIRSISTNYQSIQKIDPIDTLRIEYKSQKRSRTRQSRTKRL